MSKWVARVALGLATVTSVATAQQNSTSGDTEGALPVEQQLEQQAQRIRELQNRLQQLESAALTGSTLAEDGTGTALLAPDLGAIRETTAILTRDELASSDFPGSWPMFGSDMRLHEGGFRL